MQNTSAFREGAGFAVRPPAGGKEIGILNHEGRGTFTNLQKSLQKGLQKSAISLLQKKIQRELAKRAPTTPHGTNSSPENRPVQRIKWFAARVHQKDALDENEKNANPLGK